MGGTVVFTGQAELSAALMRKTNLDAVKTVVRANGTRLQQWTKLRAPVDTGTLFRSIDLQIKDGGLSAVVQPHTEYAAYVEFGTRKMAAQPYVKPAFNTVKAQFIAYGPTTGIIHSTAVTAERSVSGQGL